MADIATKEDIENLFQRFKVEILAELENRWNKNNCHKVMWLRSKEVKETLKISDSTLQRMRIKGLIIFKKIGGVYLYDISQFNNL